MGNPGQVDATHELKAYMARHAQGLDVPELLRLIRLFNQAANDARSAWQPSLPLEMAFIEAIEPDLNGGTTPHMPTARAPKEPAHRRPEATSSAAEEPTQAEASDDTSEEGGLTLKLVHENWRQILALIRKYNTTTEALLRSGRLLGVKNGTLYLGFSEVLRSKMEKSENIELVRRAFQQVLDIDVPIQCLVSAGKAGAIPPDIEGDGMVATALRDLGGEIVDVQ
jgi:hypothetical protein